MIPPTILPIEGPLAKLHRLSAGSSAVLRAAKARRSFILLRQILSEAYASLFFRPYRKDSAGRHLPAASTTVPREQILIALHQLTRDPAQ